MKPQGSGAAALQAMCDQGLALHRAGRLVEASEHYRRVIRRDPRHADALYLLGTILAQTGKPELGVVLIGRALAVNPTFAPAHLNRGFALRELQRFGEALESFDRVIALEPSNATAHLGRGMVLEKLDRLDGARASYDAAIALAPGLAEAHFQRGFLNEQLRRIEAAVADYDAAIALRPDYANAQSNRAFALLLSGQFEAGWRAHEWRKSDWAPTVFAAAGTRPWRGEPLEGKRLFVHHEQGFGDTIQFSRYVPLLEKRGVLAGFSVQNSLRPLLEQLPASLGVLAENETPPEFDYYCPLMSLPAAFGTRLESVPPPFPLRADGGRRARFQALLGVGTKPRIGVAWSGNPSQSNDHNRSAPFERLTALFTDEAEWVCLANEIRPSDASAFRACGRVRFLGDHLKDFADTAALLGQMDLVVTVDTSIAHLAGAMGKPVWIMLSFFADWRWLLDRDDSPWYPSARLFRQTRIGDWAGVIERVKRALPSALG